MTWRRAAPCARGDLRLGHRAPRVDKVGIGEPELAGAWSSGREGLFASRHPSARTIAASLPDWTMRPRSKSSIRTLEFTSRKLAVAWAWRRRFARRALKRERVVHMETAVLEFARRASAVISLTSAEAGTARPRSSRKALRRSHSRRARLEGGGSGTLRRAPRPTTSASALPHEDELEASGKRVLERAEAIGRLFWRRLETNQRWETPARGAQCEMPPITRRGIAAATQGRRPAVGEMSVRSPPRLARAAGSAGTGTDRGW